jgi:inorganic pyrophosphatase
MSRSAPVGQFLESLLSKGVYGRFGDRRVCSKCRAHAMTKRKTRHRSLADPADLAPLDGSDRIQVVIETPKGSRNKYAFDAEQRVFGLTRVLPAGMAFPYDFGFVPSTKAEDGDPTDVLVLMDEPAFPGCVLKCRIIGIIEGQQGKKKKGERNDRLITIEEANHSYAHVHHVRDLGKKFVQELEEFFVNYHDLQGEKYRILDVKGPTEARRRLDDGIRKVRKKS